MAIYSIKFDGYQRKLIVDYSYTKQVPFVDKRYDFELGREIEFRNYKAEEAKGTYEIAYSVAQELNLIDVEALQKVCEGEIPIKSTNQALNIFGVSKRACSNCIKLMKDPRAKYRHEEYFCHETPQHNITNPDNYECNKWVEKQ